MNTFKNDDNKDNQFKNNNLGKPSVNIKNNKNEHDNNHYNQSNQD